MRVSKKPQLESMLTVIKGNAIRPLLIQANRSNGKGAARKLASISILMTVFFMTVLSPSIIA